LVTEEPEGGRLYFLDEYQEEEKIAAAGRKKKRPRRQTGWPRNRHLPRNKKKREAQLVDCGAEGKKGGRTRLASQKDRLELLK